MKQLTPQAEQLCSRLDDNKMLRAVRSGLMLAVPAVAAGSAALFFLSIPVAAYQTFLSGFLGGSLHAFFTVVKSVTLDMISLIMLLTISFSFEQEYRLTCRGIAPFVSLSSYLAFSTAGGHPLSLELFQSIHLFNVLVVTLLSCYLYTRCARFFFRRISGAGEGSSFSLILIATLPACIVVGLFTLLNVIMTNILGVKDFQSFLSQQLMTLFQNLGRNLFSGLLFMFLLHVMWFFGIHGANVLDEVARNVFSLGVDANQQLAVAGLAPTEIVSKTFFDTFVVFGGCGALLCLAAAILVADKRRTTRRLSKIALLPALLNMNEIILFGLPVVLNPIYLIPFLVTPLVLTVISFLSMQLGLVPMAVHPVEWTTPILLSGYAATGSVRGALLQLFNLLLGVAIYLPFVRFDQRYQDSVRHRQIDRLTRIVRESERTGTRPALLSRDDALGKLARQLAGELQQAVRAERVTLYYQPQADDTGRIRGAEALLRYHRDGDAPLYPPLVIALAEESGCMDALGDAILNQACRDLKEMEAVCPLHLSFNVTAGQLAQERFVPFLLERIRVHGVRAQNLGVEVTEQTALSVTPVLLQRLAPLRQAGIQIILDDFGMGHSSMTYLQDSLFDMVKLDGSLIRDLPENERCADIISSILFLSRSLHFQVTAEYVETPEQRDRLKELGCRLYQGYLYSPAVPLPEFLTLLHRSLSPKQGNAQS